MKSGCTWWLYTKKWLYTIILIMSVVVAGCDLTSMMAINPTTTSTPAVQPPTQAIEPTEQKVVVQSEPTQVTTCTVLTGIPAGNLNLREGSGTESSVLVVLNEGDQLEYLDQETNGWKFVRQPATGIEGFVNSEFVSCTNN